MSTSLTPEVIEVLAVRIETQAIASYSLRVKLAKTRAVMIVAMLSTAVVLPLAALIYALYLLSPDNVSLQSYSLMMTLCLAATTVAITVCGIVDEVLSKQSRKLRAVAED